jgi:hypothetical protein
MGLADEVLPPDRADQAPVTAPLRELLRHLQRTADHRPSIEIVCDPDAYAQLRTYFARPYRAQPTTFCLPFTEGAVWFRRQAAAQDNGVARDTTAAQAEESAKTGSWLDCKAAEHVVSVEAMDNRVGAFVCKVAEPAATVDETPAAERADYGGAWKEPK